MNTETEFETAGKKLRLLAGRAAFWPDEQTLLVADPHLGKEATFRRHSIPVPRGASLGTLGTITRLIEQTAAEHLVVLGDLFHARSSLSPDIRGEIESFFGVHPSLRFTLVMGNHDQHVGKLPSDWPIDVVAEGTPLGPMTLGHHPIDGSTEISGDASLWVCGHVHPAIRVGSGADVAKLPCFWHTNGCLVFPAIGRFTGTHRITPHKNDQVWAIAEDQIFEYQPAKPSIAKPKNQTSANQRAKKQRTQQSTWGR